MAISSIIRLRSVSLALGFAAILVMATIHSPLIDAQQNKPKKLIASFFSVKAEGKRFVFICDRSAGMHNGKLRWDAKRRKVVPAGKFTLWERTQLELAKTIRALQGKGRFHVMFFDREITDMPGKSWRGESKKGTEELIGWINSLKARGNRKPQKALSIALKLVPKPDAIYFLSGGHVPEAQRFYEHIKKLNRDGNNTICEINTIQLIPPPEIPPAALFAARFKGKKIPPGVARLVQIQNLKFRAPAWQASRKNQRELQQRLMDAIAKSNGGKSITIEIGKR